MMHHTIPQEYRLPLFGEWDGQFKKFLSVSAGIGVLIVLVVLLTPARTALITEVSEDPEPHAKDLPVIGDGRFNISGVASSVRGQQVLHAVLDPLDRVPEPHRYEA